MAQNLKKKILSKLSVFRQSFIIKEEIFLKEDGFSMFELLTVVSLTAVFVAMIIPTYLGSVRVTSLNTSANQIVTDIRKAQARSMATGTRYGYKFLSGQQTYQYIKDTGTEEVLETRELAQNVTILNTSFPLGKLTFVRSGAANQAGYVRIMYSDGTIKSVNVVRITGKASIQ